MNKLKCLLVLALGIFLGSCNIFSMGGEEVGVREPIIVYLTVEDGNSVLISVDLDLHSEILYSTEETIFEFAPSGEGSYIALVVENSQGGSDLWRLDRDGSNATTLVDCGPGRCSAPAWSPVGDRIAYSRETLDHDQGFGFSPPRLWTVDANTRETSELIHDDHILHGGPSWSPDGRWLAFYDLV